MKASVIVAVVAWLVLASAAQAGAAGDKWEVTTSMAMEGMAMPPRTQSVCSPPQSDRPPVGDGDGHCEMYDAKRSGSGFSWKMRCKGSPPSEGSGEMSYQGRDAYSGTMTFASQGRTMTMKLAGKRVGDCNAAEERRQVDTQIAAIRQQQAQGMAQVCASAVESMNARVLLPESNMNCAASYKNDLCKRVQGYDGYSRLAAMRGAAGGVASLDGIKDAGQLCAFDPAALHQRLCKQAEGEEALDFLGGQCLADGFGKTVIARECVGRDFTTPAAPKYRSFCAAAANQRLVPTVAKAPEPAASVGAKDVAKDALNKGKDLLKGLFR